MFKKILIANRGEIAVRIMATCREMGIATVAVYSAADRAARHVREADEAYPIGPAAATQSYLRGEKIIEVARQCGAEAIHPGYGFLSENTSFVEACEAAGLVFIGPPASAMRLMGSKIAAKQLAMSVNAPTIPGYNGESQDDELLLQEARQIGFPLLIKASAGGGGKGMREVHEQEAFLEELAGARREALASFGDATVFLERLLLRPRHIEIQVLGDQYGHLIHLGERECSIQRRHQKIVEESPSVALTPALRAEMGAAAVRIAQAAGYVNAGTMEFMLDEDRHFYFLEMNTRLQVEHPVTELVTDLDLVRQQILIAAGEPLALKQEEIIPRGHAIEVRLYAEDPEQGFLPSTGTVAHFSAPGGPGVRVDSGISSGDEISQFYDPMIAKLIVFGEDRTAAVARLRAALAHTVVFGVNTNLALLQAIAEQPAYAEGQTATSFLEEHGLLTPGELSRDGRNLTDALYAAALLDLTGGPHSRERNPWRALGPWRMIGEARGITYTYQQERYRVTLSPANGQADAWQVRVNDGPAEPMSYTIGPENLLILLREHRQTRLRVLREEQRTLVSVRGQVFPLRRQQPPDVASSARASLGGQGAPAQKALTAPMAGTIVKVQVQDGQEVEQRQVLLILTAMKMEHTIAAPHAGKIRHIHYKEGDVVKGGAVLVEME
ncbi:MAG TPA: acetyl-CoA carboxylase biotin carboxylase subunit [Ktedonobacteraceae bacterium]|nr:acetyl-CoA carboxylase biotin carboxylase subunit [Ktedonobacteraceae bacterium]